ncbi:MAG: DUF1295 domain-containing protein [Bacteroidetes bacterium]|nr:DUF1295 domain-containing protein [Bacteroidota bacterium]
MDKYLLIAFAICGISVMIHQSLAFVVALIRKNNGIADIAWGLGFIIICACSLFVHSLLINIERPLGFNPTFILLITLVTIWGLRLSGYLFIRNWNKPEDWRYANWREEWGTKFFLKSYLQVFLLQGFLMLVIASPIILSGFYSLPAALISYSVVHYTLIATGITVWLIGFFFEAVGDSQLAGFKQDPANKGRIMRYGVWQYTRHPNYFGEASMWWGIFLLSCVSAHGVIDILRRAIGPATITFMLLRVSGVTMLESKYKGNKEYEDYQKRTSAFIPMPTKKGAV